MRSPRSRAWAPTSDASTTATASRVTSQPAAHRRSSPLVTAARSHRSRSGRSSPLAARAVRGGPPGQHRLRQRRAAADTGLAGASVDQKGVLILPLLAEAVAVVVDAGAAQVHGRGERGLDSLVEPPPTG